MQASGFDDIIRDLLLRDQIVYGGYSAGVAMLTPALHGIELVDDALTVPPGYDVTIIWDCLGLLPWAVAPHYKSAHPESAAIDDVVSYYIKHHIPFRALRDGEVIVIRGECEEVLR